MKSNCNIAAIVSLASVSATQAAETVTHQYDELGRLVSSSNSGGPRAGIAAETRYDPAGNRQAVAVGQPLPPQPSNASVFSITGPSGNINEGGTATFLVLRTGTASGPLSVSYASFNGSATAPSDYVAASGVLTFSFWETAKTISIPIVVDGLGETVESFSLQLSSPSVGASLGTASAIAQIEVSAPANQPPTANVNTLSLVACEAGVVDVLANDTDPEGNYPLTLVSVGQSTLGTAYVSGTKFGFSAGGAVGSQNVTYVVRDSLGAASTGIVAVSVRGQCL